MSTRKPIKNSDSSSEKVEWFRIHANVFHKNKAAGRTRITARSVLRRLRGVVSGQRRLCFDILFKYTLLGIKDVFLALILRFLLPYDSGSYVPSPDLCFVDADEVTALMIISISLQKDILF